MNKLDQKQKTFNFIELDRRFRKLNPQENSEEAAFESYTASLMGLKNGLDWNSLLGHPLVVVLGEPGSGKTWEFRERARRLRDRGEKSFFIHLDQLITEPLNNILSEEEYRIFLLWKRSNEKATFFLDSVDEAKYQKTSDFLTAIDRFRNAVGTNNITRTCLLLSSRISEWRPQSDAIELVNRFPCSKGSTPHAHQTNNEDKKQEDILVVQIEPLDRSQVECFTHELNIVDSAAFILALDEKHAWPFARRPIDVIDLLNYWNTYRRLGSLKELIEHDVNQKIKEPRERQDILTPEKARIGAEILGATVVFCHNFNIYVPDDSHVTDTSAIDSSACLPEDWLPRERQSLLTRPLFDGATYGRIRFHHRRSAEYLASRWLSKRMEEGCTTPILKDILFTSIHNQDVLRPSLAPVAAWLCIGKERWQEDIGHYILKSAPEIHLRYGDPSQLSLEYKRQLLKALVDKYKERDHIWIDTEYEALSRLADPGLKDDLVKIISDRNISEDIRSEMMRLIQHGRITGCLDTVLNIVADVSESDNLKAYAVIAVRDAGDLTHLCRLWEITKKYSHISSRLCSHLSEALYPKAIDAAGLAELLIKSDEVPKNSVDLPYYLRHHLENVLTPENSANLLIQLSALFEQEPYIKKDKDKIPISANFFWLGEVIPSILKILFEKKHLTDAETTVAARSFFLLKHFHNVDFHKPDIKADFNTLTNRHPIVRRRLFWLLVDEQKRKKSIAELNNPIYLFHNSDVLKPLPNDLEWSIDDLTSVKEKCDHLNALRMAINLWNVAGRKWKDRQRIKHAIANNIFLQKEFKRLAEYGPLVWAKGIWYRHLKYKLTYRWWWKGRFCFFRNKYRELRWQWAYLRHIRLLKNGEATGWLYNLAFEADESHSQYAPRTWNKLVEKRGRLIAWAVKEGCKSVWRQFTPLLPHEKPEPLQTDRRVIVGLAGIQVAILDGELDFGKMNGDDARLAARYAVNELNGFSPWLSELAITHSDAVRDILNECIRGEWKFEATREHVYEVLCKLSWNDDGLIHLVMNSLIELIQSGDPQNIKILEATIKILLKEVHLSKSMLATIAPARIIKYDRDSREFIFWLSVWMEIDAGAAVPYLQQVLSTVPDANILMVRLCDTLKGDRLQNIRTSAPDYAEPVHLRALLPLIYLHVNPSEDIHHEGTYTPTARDDAQRFRDSLLGNLSQSESAEADEVLNEFLQTPALASYKDYILHLIDQRAERQADFPSWCPVDVRTFAKEHETVPKTDGDLFKISFRRLYEIKHDVEKADNSIRFEVHKDDDERKLRIWLARKLHERSRNRYTVPQEEEIDRRERPDLRIEKPGMASVSIEIKWAENWTLPQLIERLENQLVGQYLRDDISRYGIYLLGYIGRQKTWENPDNASRVSFEQVVAIIEKRAKEIVAARRNIGDIAVIPLDFTEH